MVLVSPARTAGRPEDRFEGIAQGDSRIRLGHSGQRSVSRPRVPRLTDVAFVEVCIAILDREAGVFPLAPCFLIPQLNHS